MELTTEERQLSRNSIVLFILRFDIQQNTSINFEEIIVDISKYFDRTEKRLQTNLKIDFTTDKNEVNKIESFDYVLIKEKERYSMTFSISQNAFWFETSNYINNHVYIKVINELLTSIQNKNIEIPIRRIGMRFINNFKCDTPKQISKIFNNDISKSITQRLNQNNSIRIINQDEFNFEDCKARINYGIPNKFYPSSIKNYDLLLDIDSYEESIQKFDDTIKEKIGKLNHIAFQKFINYINPNFLNILK